MNQFTQKGVGLDCFDHRISHDSIVSHTIKVNEFFITYYFTADAWLISCKPWIGNLKFT